MAADNSIIGGPHCLCDDGVEYSPCCEERRRVEPCCEQQFMVVVRGENNPYRGEQCPNSCFRDPLTGESVLPVDAYVKFTSQLGWYQCVQMFMIATLVPIFFFGPFVLPALYWDGYGLAWLWIPVWAAGVAVANHIAKACNSQILKLLEEHRDKFLNPYGVDLGWHNCSTSGVSYYWLRRPRQQQLQHELPASPTGAFPHQNETLLPSKDLPEAFPPIYLSLSAPGDISVGEAYHPSMQMEKSTWTLIQNTHRELVKPTCMKKLILVIWLLLYLPGFSSVIMLWINFVNGFLLLLILNVIWFFLLWGAVFVLLARWSASPAMQSCQTVMETVNRVLQARQASTEDTSSTKSNSSSLTLDNRYGYTYNEQMAGYSLQFMTSPLPGREGSFCWRYQLVRNSPITAASFETSPLPGRKDRSSWRHQLVQNAPITTAASSETHNGHDLELV